MVDEKKDITEKMRSAGWHLAQVLYKFDDTLTMDKLIKKYSWKMMNYIYVANKTLFVFYLEKLCFKIEKQIHKDAINLLKAQDEAKFRELALAFMMGFVSERNENRYEKKGGEDEQQQQ